MRSASPRSTLLALTPAWAAAENGRPELALLGKAFVGFWRHGYLSKTNPWDSGWARGERKLENDFRQENLSWTERPYGTFMRTFNLPQTVDVNTINATYTNGILQIVLAKQEAAKPKQIPKVTQKELTASAPA